VRGGVGARTRRLIPFHEVCTRRIGMMGLAAYAMARVHHHVLPARSHVKRRFWTAWHSIASRLLGRRYITWTTTGQDSQNLE
jgi:hypothetical protein